MSLSGLGDVLLLLEVVAPPSGCSGIDKGHSNVANAGSGGQALVVVSEPARVHEGPALARRLDRAVVAEEPAAAALQEANCSAVLVWLHTRNNHIKQMHQFKK